MYEIVENFINQNEVFNYDSPILNVSWNDIGIIAGCGDKTVRLFDVNKKHNIKIGDHNEAVSSVHWIQNMNLIVSMSYDKTIKY